MRLPDSAVGAVAAALIGALLTLLGLLISKEQKISEFRQAWIDEVRKDIALLIAAFHAIDDTERIYEKIDGNAWKEVRQDYLAINGALLRVKLRLNVVEQASIKLIGLLDDVGRILMRDDVKSRRGDLLVLEEKLVEAAGSILKTEWERVKTGELTYRLARGGAVALCIIAAMVLFAAEF